MLMKVRLVFGNSQPHGDPLQILTGISHSEGWRLPNTHLCQTRSGPSLSGSPGCPCAPSLSRRWSAAGRAASAGAAALFPKSPSGADSSGPSPPVSERAGGGNVSGIPLNKDVSVD